MEEYLLKFIWRMMNKKISNARMNEMDNDDILSKVNNEAGLRKFKEEVVNKRSSNVNNNHFLSE